MKREGVGALGSTGDCFSFVDSSLESLPSLSFDRLNKIQLMNCFTLEPGTKYSDLAAVQKLMICLDALELALYTVTED